MEPMTTSPVSSPASPSNFLPAFLLGEARPSTPRPAALSPSKSQQPRPCYKPASGSSATPARRSIFEETAVSAMNGERCGPPARGLFDTLEPALDASSHLQSPALQLANPCLGLQSPYNASQLLQSHQSSPGLGQAESCFTPVPLNMAARNLNNSICRANQLEGRVDTLWVTVLGFPASSAGLVLAQFSQCGTIIDKKFPSAGNWMHLKFSRPLEVSRALAYNGKLISSSIMVGVLPYKNPDDKENGEVLSDAATTIVSPNRARPLSQPLEVTLNSSNVVLRENLPQKSTGIITRAMEYVLGW